MNNETRKIIKELRGVKEELEQLKSKQNKSILISSFFFTIPLGLAIFLYFTNTLNEVLNARAIEWVAWLGIIVGILMMMFPSILASRRRKAYSE
jgi:uncharacterized membrane protein